MACAHAVLLVVISSLCCSVARLLLGIRCSSMLLHLCYAMSMAVQHGLCAYSGACCDLAQVVAACLNLMDSHVQQPVASPVVSCVMQC